MKVNCVKVGILNTNCYVLDIDNDVLVIDPGAEYKKIVPFLENKKILGVIITHHHFDHVGALKEFKDIPVYDAYNMQEGINNIGVFKFEVIYTPGHKEDAISIYFKEEKMMFVGDFIFKGGLGRTDLAGSNIMAMNDSLEKIKKYSMDTIIYPGHGDSTILGDEII